MLIKREFLILNLTILIIATHIMCANAKSLPPDKNLEHRNKSLRFSQNKSVLYTIPKPIKDISSSSHKENNLSTTYMNDVEYNLRLRQLMEELVLRSHFESQLDITTHQYLETTYEQETDHLTNNDQSSTSFLSPIKIENRTQELQQNLTYDNFLPLYLTNHNLTQHFNRTASTDTQKIRQQLEFLQKNAERFKNFKQVHERSKNSTSFSSDLDLQSLEKTGFLNEIYEQVNGRSKNSSFLSDLGLQSSEIIDVLNKTDEINDVNIQEKTYTYNPSQNNNSTMGFEYNSLYPNVTTITKTSNKFVVDVRKGNITEDLNIDMKSNLSSAKQNVEDKKRTHPADLHFQGNEDWKTFLTKVKLGPGNVDISRSNSSTRIEGNIVVHNSSSDISQSIKNESDTYSEMGINDRIVNNKNHNISSKVSEKSEESAKHDANNESHNNENYFIIPSLQSNNEITPDTESPLFMDSQTTNIVETYRNRTKDEDLNTKFIHNDTKAMKFTEYYKISPVEQIAENFKNYSTTTEPIKSSENPTWENSSQIPQATTTSQLLITDNTESTFPEQTTEVYSTYFSESPQSIFTDNFESTPVEEITESFERTENFISVKNGTNVEITQLPHDFKKLVWSKNQTNLHTSNLTFVENSETKFLEQTTETMAVQFQSDSIIDYLDSKSQTTTESAETGNSDNKTKEPLNTERTTESLKQDITEAETNRITETLIEDFKNYSTTKLPKIATEIENANFSERLQSVTSRDVEENSGKTTTEITTELLNSIYNENVESGITSETTEDFTNYLTTDSPQITTKVEKLKFTQHFQSVSTDTRTTTELPNSLITENFESIIPEETTENFNNYFTTESLQTTHISNDKNTEHFVSAPPKVIKGNSESYFTNETTTQLPKSIFNEKITESLNDHVTTVSYQKTTEIEKFSDNFELASNEDTKEISESYYYTETTTELPKSIFSEHLESQVPDEITGGFKKSAILDETTENFNNYFTNELLQRTQISNDKFTKHFNSAPPKLTKSSEGYFTTEMTTQLPTSIFNENFESRNSGKITEVFNDYVTTETLQKATEIENARFSDHFELASNEGTKQISERYFSIKTTELPKSIFPEHFESTIPEELTEGFKNTLISKETTENFNNYESLQTTKISNQKFTKELSESYFTTDTTTQLPTSIFYENFESRSPEKVTKGLNDYFQKITEIENKHFSDHFELASKNGTRENSASYFSTEATTELPKSVFPENFEFTVREEKTEDFKKSIIPDETTENFNNYFTTETTTQLPKSIFNENFESRSPEKITESFNDYVRTEGTTEIENAKFSASKEDIKENSESNFSTETTTELPKSIFSENVESTVPDEITEGLKRSPIPDETTENVNIYLTIKTTQLPKSISNENFESRNTEHITESFSDYVTTESHQRTTEIENAKFSKHFELASNEDTIKNSESLFSTETTTEIPKSIFSENFESTVPDKITEGFKKYFTTETSQNNIASTFSTITSTLLATTSIPTDTSAAEQKNMDPVYKYITSELSLGIVNDLNETESITTTEFPESIYDERIYNNKNMGSKTLLTTEHSELNDMTTTKKLPTNGKNNTNFELINTVDVITSSLSNENKNSTPNTSESHIIFFKSKTSENNENSNFNISSDFPQHSSMEYQSEDSFEQYFESDSNEFQSHEQYIHNEMDAYEIDYTTEFSSISDAINATSNKTDPLKNDYISDGTQSSTTVLPYNLDTTTVENDNSDTQNNIASTFSTTTSTLLTTTSIPTHTSTPEQKNMDSVYKYITSELPLGIVNDFNETESITTTEFPESIYDESIHNNKNMSSKTLLTTEHSELNDMTITQKLPTNTKNNKHFEPINTLDMITSSLSNEHTKSTTKTSESHKIFFKSKTSENNENSNFNISSDFPQLYSSMEYQSEDSFEQYFDTDSNEFQSNEQYINNEMDAYEIDYTTELSSISDVFNVTSNKTDQLNISGNDINNIAKNVNISDGKQSTTTLLPYNLDATTFEKDNSDSERQSNKNVYNMILSITTNKPKIKINYDQINVEAEIDHTVPSIRHNLSMAIVKDISQEFQKHSKNELDHNATLSYQSIYESKNIYTTQKPLSKYLETESLIEEQSSGHVNPTSEMHVVKDEKIKIDEIFEMKNVEEKLPLTKMAYNNTYNQKSSNNDDSKEVALINETIHSSNELNYDTSYKTDLNQPDTNENNNDFLNKSSLQDFHIKHLITFSENTSLTENAGGVSTDESENSNNLLENVLLQNTNVRHQDEKIETVTEVVWLTQSSSYQKPSIIIENIPYETSIPGPLLPITNDITNTGKVTVLKPEETPDNLNELIAIIGNSLQQTGEHLQQKEHEKVNRNDNITKVHNLQLIQEDVTSTVNCHTTSMSFSIPTASENDVSNDDDVDDDDFIDETKDEIKANDESVVIKKTIAKDKQNIEKWSKFKNNQLNNDSLTKFSNLAMNDNTKADDVDSLSDANTYIVVADVGAYTNATNDDCCDEGTTDFSNEKNMRLETKVGYEHIANGKFYKNSDDNDKVVDNLNNDTRSAQQKKMYGTNVEFKTIQNDEGIYEISTIENKLLDISKNKSNVMITTEPISYDKHEIVNNKNLKKDYPNKGNEVINKNNSIINLNLMSDIKTAKNKVENDAVSLEKTEDNKYNPNTGIRNMLHNLLKTQSFPAMTPYYLNANHTNVNKNTPASAQTKEEITTTNWWNSLPYAEIRKFLNSIFDSITSNDEFTLTGSSDIAKTPSTVSTVVPAAATSTTRDNKMKTRNERKSKKEQWPTWILNNIWLSII